MPLSPQGQIAKRSSPSGKITQTIGNGKRTKFNSETSTSKLLIKKSVEETRTLYRSTQPIDSSGMFNQGFRDDNYYRTFVQDAQKAEIEVFYDEQNEVHSKFDQEKLTKILVGTYLIWNDDKFDTLFPKIQLLVEAKADINTTYGGGMFRTSLIERTFSSKHKKLRQALINLADPLTLEPKVGKSMLSLACDRCDYIMMKILLGKNCEPNRIEDDGRTPLITLCWHWTHQDEDIDYEQQLKCIELLLNFEGPDAKTLKAIWVKKWLKVCPDSIAINLTEVADFCIPNINVRPVFKGETAQGHLRS
jgi:hypothetical protein